MGYKIENNLCEIYCSRNNGLFSNFFEIVNILHELEFNDINFNEIKIDNFSKNYSIRNTNSFYDFFDINIDKTIIIDKKNYGKTVESFLISNGVETCDIFIDNDKIKYINSLLKKYIKPNKFIKERIDSFFYEFIENKKILGVHIRRTDHEGHGKFINIDNYINYINKIIPDFDNLFIITDDNNIINLFSSIYGNKLIMVDNIIRSTNNIAIHYGNNDKYKIGCDVVIEASLLGMCDKIIGTSSNVLMFSLCNQEINNYIMLDLNLNINKDIVFYNNFHNGDLHYSREFIKDIYKKTKSLYNDFYHYHKFNNSDVLFDIDKIINMGYLPNLPDNRGIYDNGRTVFINTWIGHNNMRYLTKSCSLFSNYNMFKEIYNFLNIEIEDIEFYIPKVDIDNEYTISIDNFFKTIKSNKIILLSNGDVNSGQSTNFDFTSVVNTLGSEYSDQTFICTNKNFTPKTTNIFFTNDIIKKIGCDLNEIGYLSKYCDIIIGRASGPYCFTHIKENINNTEKTFISFSNIKYEGVWYNGNAKNVWSNNFNINNIIDTIKQEL